MTLLDLLQEHRIPFKRSGEHEHVSPGWVGIDCPRCSPGWRHFRLGVHLEGLYAHCWLCGGVPLLRTLAELTGEKVPVLREQLGTQSPRKEQETTRGILKEPDGIGKMQPPHKKYLTSRGYDPEEIDELWGVKGIGVHPRYAWRLYIPVLFDWETASWTTRAITDTHRRYLSAPADAEKLPIKSLLYGDHLAKHAVAVVEGPTDAWRIGPGAVATFGTAFTPAQVLRLSRFPVRIVAFDPEPAAQVRARKLCRMLATLPGLTMQAMLRSGDPGSASKREIRELQRMLI